MSGIHNEVTHRPASTEEDGVWAWVFREREDWDGEWMGLCVVMNRRAAVEGGAEGGEERSGERKEVGEEVVDEEELEVVCACLCCCDCGIDYWNRLFHSETIYYSSIEELCGFYSINGYDRTGYSIWKMWKPVGFELWVVQETEEIENW